MLGACGANTGYGYGGKWIWRKHLPSLLAPTETDSADCISILLRWLLADRPITKYCTTLALQEDLGLCADAVFKQVPPVSAMHGSVQAVLPFYICWQDLLASDSSHLGRVTWNKTTAPTMHFWANGNILQGDERRGGAACLCAVEVVQHSDRESATVTATAPGRVTIMCVPCCTRTRFKDQVTQNTLARSQCPREWAVSLSDVHWSSEGSVMSGWLGFKPQTASTNHRLPAHCIPHC